MIARKRICKGRDISVEDLFIDKSATVDMNTTALHPEYGLYAPSNGPSPPGDV